MFKSLVLLNTAAIVFSLVTEAASVPYAAPYLVKDINPGPCDPSGSCGGYSELIDVSGTLFFLTYDPAVGEQPLWKSDGTAAGTVRIGDLTGWNILYFTAVNGTFFFAAVDPNDGYRALWKTDGTARDTVGLAGFDQDPGDNPTAINGTLFFIANGGGSPERIGELWKSDGTVTERAAALGPRIESDRFGWDHWNLTNVNGTLFFFSGHELWKSDGTAGGTLPVAAITPAFATYQWSLFELTEVNGALFFAGCESLGRCELWRSDGTTAGTVRVVTFDAGSHLDEMNLPQLTSASGMLFFSACDPTTGTDCALWKSDGTPEGTVLVKDIVPDLGRGLSVNVNGTLFFRAYEPGAGIRVWKTDGTAECRFRRSRTARPTEGEHLIRAKPNTSSERRRAARPEPRDRGVSTWLSSARPSRSSASSASILPSA